MTTLLSSDSVDNLSISFIDLYHEVVKDFGINLEANLNVKESDITFNDDLEDAQEISLVNEITGDMDGIPIVPIKESKYLKFHIKNSDEFMKLMQRECSLRKKVKMLDDARGTIRGKCHTVYLIEVNHK